MNDTTIGFLREPHVAIVKLDEGVSEITWSNRTKRNSVIFTALKESFDYYFIDDILIVPDPTTYKKSNFHECLIDGIHFQVSGSFIAFFNILKRTDKVIIGGSLTLQQYCFLKKKIKIKEE
jgi:hypothetical protein